MRANMLRVVHAGVAALLTLAAVGQVPAYAAEPPAGAQPPAQTLGGVPSREQGLLQMRRLSEAFRPSDDAVLDARAKFRAGDIAGAEAACRTALSLSPKLADGTPWNSTAIRLLGDMQLRQGKPADALRAFLACYGNSFGPDYNNRIAIAYARLRDYAHARAYLTDEPVRRYRDYWADQMPGAGDCVSIEASASIVLGLGELSVRDLPSATTYFEAALRLAPKNAVACYHLGNIYREKEDYARALPLLREAARQGRGDLARTARKRIEGIEMWLKELERRKKEAAAAQASKQPAQ